MDVTKLVAHCRESGTSFFINYLFLCARALNSIEEFRCRLVNGEPWIYDKLDCSFTTMNDFGYFVNRSVAFEDYDAFYKNASEIIQKAKQEKNIHPETVSDLSRVDLCYYSCIPWVDYQSMTLPVITRPSGSNDQTGDSVPRIGWGKFVEENGRYRMTMHITVSHAFVDGKPLAEAFNRVQDALNELDFYA